MNNFMRERSCGLFPVDRSPKFRIIISKDFAAGRFSQIANAFFTNPHDFGHRMF